MFGGNQLAVFTDAEGLADDEMLAIAREMNYSETTFVLPAKQSDALCRVRIFTPSVELPFAGHPVVGTALALAADGRIAPKAETALSGDQAIARFELGVGTLPVEVHFTDGRPDFVWMMQPLPSFTPWTGQPARMAAAIGVPSDALALESFPIEWGSAGVAFLFVPLRSAADLAAAHPSPELLCAPCGWRRDWHLSLRHAGRQPRASCARQALCSWRWHHRRRGHGISRRTARRILVAPRPDRVRSGRYGLWHPRTRDRDGPTQPDSR